MTNRPRILLARPDHMGDVLLTLPAAARLRRALPDAHIAFLVPATVAAIPRHCPPVDEVRTAAYPPLLPWPGPPDWPQRAAEDAEKLTGQFDAAILPRPDDPLSGPLVRRAGIPLRFGYATAGTAPFLTHALPIGGPQHVVQTALALAELAAVHLGATPASGAEGREGSLIVPTAAEMAEAAAALSGLAQRCGSRPVVLHPGAGWRLKQWPSRCWATLAGRLRAALGVAPLLIHGPGEDDLAAAIVAQSGGAAVRLEQPLSFGGLAALLRRARLVIALDGGPMHLAALLGTSVVALFGPADPREFAPWCPPARARVVRVALPCSPCRTLIDPPCGAREQPLCMRKIGVDQVLAAATDLLARQDTRADGGAGM